MIQRVQTIWLLLAAGASLASLKFPFYSGSKENGLFEEVSGSTGFLLLIISIAVALAALVAIFLFKNRKLQKQISWLGLLLQIITLVLLFSKTKPFTQGNFSLTSILSFSIPIFFMLAWLSIRKDDKLVRSMDRLR